MTQPLLRLSGTVPVSHHQFFLLDARTYPTDGGRLSWRDNGLATSAAGILALSTGIHTGEINLVVERFDNAPPPDLHGWEDVTELDLQVPHGELHVAGLMLEPAPELRTPLTIVGGRCRARIHATGRDTDIDGAPPEPVEDYLIQLWDTDTDAPANLLRSTSHYGANERT
ncbi:hypothetical protein [Saccharopolyspora dendranthemae]|uniref:Uncharacterized protein n=1 Tax=Saccharopolyspora dendranthemae TaxID=1181886 RepID=A0A561V7L0_9PSEU|nr:hypothetical protein [Saccharopolyspora dendranthemae]TWG07606.1 hypothetical protein FHU35_11223 [Saccharopolyspora dendranthemae]